MRLNNIKLSGIVLLTLLVLSSCKNVVENNYIVVDGFAQGGTYHVVYEKPSSDFNLNIKDSLDLYFQQINKSVNGYDSLSLIDRKSVV